MGSESTILLAGLCLLEALFIVLFFVRQARERGRDKELAKVRLSAWHSERVATVRTVVATMAHDLRQPLAAILNNAAAAREFLRPKIPDLGEVREILDDIVLDSDRASGILTGISHAFRGRETPHISVSLASSIQGTLALLEKEIEGQGVLVKFVRRDDCVVTADEAQIRLVLINLVTNAIEAMQDRPEPTRHLEIILAPVAPGLAQVTVSDSGAGMTEENSRHLFAPFWKSNNQGMGIGLCVCRSVIQAHGGRIWHTNNSNGGSSFCFTLPLAKIGSVSNQEAESAGSQSTIPSRPVAESVGGPPKNVRVLVVDDSAPYRQTLMSVLRDLPHVELAGEASDGLEALQMSAELRPDLILMDVSLPGINGIDLASRLRETCPNAKLLFLSQYDDPDIVRAVLHTGALGYVHKIDVGKELLHAVDAVLRGDKFLSVSVRGIEAGTNDG